MISILQWILLWQVHKYPVSLAACIYECEFDNTVNYGSQENLEAV